VVGQSYLINKSLYFDTFTLRERERKRERERERERLTEYYVIDILVTIYVTQW
jgi:hypothetical protein